MVILVFIKPDYLSAEAIAPEKAVAIAESLEKTFRVLRWKAHCVELELADSRTWDSTIGTKPGFGDAQIVFDPVGRRYRIDIQMVHEWVNGDAPYVGSVFGNSFDGEIYRRWEQHKPGTELPTIDEKLPAWGDISKDRSDLSEKQDIVTCACIATGLGCMPPYVWDGGESPNQPLSRLMRKWITEKRGLSVTDDGDGKWTITTPVSYAGHSGYVLRMGYDIAKGGIVTDSHWIFLREGQEVENCRLEIELQAMGDGIWVPKTAKWGNLLNKPPSIVVASFDAVEINPVIEDGVFSLPFPDGVRVTDHIKKRVYTSGNAMNEPESVRKFMELNNLTGKAKDTPTPFMSHRQILVGGSAFLLVATIAILALHRIRRNKKWEASR